MKRAAKVCRDEDPLIVIVSLICRLVKSNTLLMRVFGLTELKAFIHFTDSLDADAVK